MSDDVGRSFRRVSTGVLAIVLGLAAPGAMAGSILNDYSVITAGSLNTGSDILGPSLVGGNASVATVGGQSGADWYGTNLVTVLGNFTGNGANFEYGGGLAVSPTSTISGNYNFNPDSGGHKGSISTLTSSQVSSIQSELNLTTGVLATNSVGFAGMATNGSASTSGTVTTLTINSVSNGFAVVNVPLSSLTVQNGTVVLQLENGVQLSSITSLILNVTGGSGSETIPNTFTGFFTQINGVNTTSSQLSDLIAHTVWNFGTSVTTLNVDKDMYGAILAPDANLSTGATLDGSVWVDSIVSTNGEIHTPLYAGDPYSSAVPEPSTLVLAGIPIFFAGLHRWLMNRYKLSRVPG
jgi:hypothetical protein